MLDIYLVVAEVYKENKKGAIFLKHFYQCPLQQHFAPSLVPFYFRLFLFWQIWKFPIIVHQIWNETEVHFHNILYIAREIMAGKISNVNADEKSITSTYAKESVKKWIFQLIKPSQSHFIACRTPKPFNRLLTGLTL